MHKRSAYYVSNPEYQVKFIGNGTRIEPRATRAVAWLTFNEAKDLRDKGWIVNLKDGPTEEGIGPVKEETDTSVSWDDIENKPVGSFVADATEGTEVTTINALLASLRSAGFIE